MKYYPVGYKSHVPVHSLTSPTWFAPFLGPTVSCWNFRSGRGKDEMGWKKCVQVSMIDSLYSQRPGYFPFSSYLPIFAFCKSVFFPLNWIYYPLRLRGYIFPLLPKRTWLGGSLLDIPKWTLTPDLFSIWSSTWLLISTKPEQQQRKGQRETETKTLWAQGLWGAA